MLTRELQLNVSIHGCEERALDPQSFIVTWSLLMYTLLRRRKPGLV